METTLRQSLTLFAAGALFAACSAPTVNLATGEPIKVDINMRLDVYQYNATGTNAPASSVKPGPDQSPEARRRNRMADIQTFKGNQLVGEGRDGLVVIRPKAQEEKPEYRDYIRLTVDAENSDRIELMKTMAENQKTSLPEIQSKQAEIWRNRSFKGEWIEIPGPEPGQWIWIQKQG